MGRKAIICFSTHSDKDDSSKKTAIIFFAAGCLSAAGLLAAFYAGMRIKAPKEEEQSMPSRPPRSFVNTRRNRSSNNLNDGKPPSSVHVMPLRRKKSESRYGLRTRLDPKMVSPIIDGIQSKVHEEANRKALTVGVAGGSGSGKTTFAQALYHAVGEENVTYITHDNYYKDLSHLPVKERAVHNFDHPESLDTALLVEHLRCLKRSQNVNIPVYDFSTHSRSSKVVTLAEPRQVIIVEGILIFSDLVLVRELDIKVFVDTEADVRLIRRIHRDVKERGRTLDSIIEQYVKTVRPMHMEFVEPSKTKADVIIPSGINQVALDMFLSRLRSEIDGSNGGGGTSELASFSTGM